MEIIADIMPNENHETTIFEKMYLGCVSYKTWRMLCKVCTAM